LIPNDIALVTAPIYQAGAMGSMMANVYRGNTIVMLNGFNLDTVLSTIERERVTTALFVPTMITKLLQVKNLERYDLSSLKTVIYGSAPMPVAVLKEAMERFGWEFMGACGATETGPAYIAVLDYEDHHLNGSTKMEKRLYSIGKEGINCRVKIFNDDDKELPVGEVGEIVVRGQGIMKGYWQKSNDTADALRSGWYHTGDLGFIDNDGYIYIVDRKKDLIISGGFNIYPREIENVLEKHPAVMECAVIGIPHDLWGETPKALVVLRENQTNVSQVELMDFVKKQIAGYKIPKGGIEFVKSLPRNASGKILKRELREKYQRIQLN
jgi:acyl-CoA synthetase (AMP-forming)/AMP-acid ligase II